MKRVITDFILSTKATWRGWQISHFEVGDWLVSVDIGFFHSYGFFREIYEYAGPVSPYLNPQQMMLGRPLLEDQIPMIDYDRRPHELRIGEWRRMKDEEKANIIAHRLKGDPAPVIRHPYGTIGFRK